MAHPGVVHAHRVVGQHLLHRALRLQELRRIASDCATTDCLPPPSRRTLACSTGE